MANWKYYLRDVEKFDAQLEEISNPARDERLRYATAKNLLAIMRLRGIPVSHRPEEVDLFTFAVAYHQLITHTTFDVPVPSKQGDAQ